MALHQSSNVFSDALYVVGRNHFHNFLKYYNYCTFAVFMLCVFDNGGDINFHTFSTFALF